MRPTALQVVRRPAGSHESAATDWQVQVGSSRFIFSSEPQHMVLLAHLHARNLLLKGPLHLLPGNRVEHSYHLQTGSVAAAVQC